MSNNQKKYNSLNDFYRKKFQKKVFKVNLNGNFTCPNRDGTVGTNGCIYCSDLGSGEFAGHKNDDLVTQFNKVKENLHRKWPEGLYIGYFQANSNTYAPVAELKEKYETILKQKNVVGLSIATRSDAINTEVLNYLGDLNKKTFLTIELGLQTIHPATNILINRCHTLANFENIVHQLHKKDINIVVHVINGLPYETKEMMLNTIEYLNTLPITGIKFHMLSVLKNTKLATIYQKEKFKLLSEKEYLNILCQQINILRPDIVVHRLVNDPKKDDLIAPKWLLKKFEILNKIDNLLEEKKIYQGKNYCQ